jgi:hypothetical protein
LSRRRREPRYASNLAVILHDGEGIARNVSASGIYFETQLRFKKGDEVQFTVDYMPEALTMQCRGRVVHIENIKNLFGIGACIDDFTLRRAKAAKR